MVILFVYCVSKVVFKVYGDLVCLLLVCDGIYFVIVLFGFVKIVMSDVFLGDKLFMWLVDKVVGYICCKLVVWWVEIVFLGLFVFGMCLLMLLLV